MAIADATASPATRFADELREANLATWGRAVEHRFVRELAAGTIDDGVMAGYLIQDYRFLDGFLALVGAAIASADTLAARLRLAAFAGEVAGDENTYFLRAFDALGADESTRADVPDTIATRGFKAIFREAADTRRYAAALSVLIVCEWLYLEWAQPRSGSLPPSFVHAEWIALHDYPGFAEFVGFLRDELDRVGPADADVARDFFARTVQLELDFFDESYARPFAG